MGYHPRIESKEYGSFLTTRSRASELWFVNNKHLEEAILGYAAKFRERYSVKLYALAIEGNHTQMPALFPEGNRADFMRDLNSCVARAVPRYVSRHPGGRFWGRRYSQEFLPGDEDIEEKFWYTVLQPVQDGLVERISDYPGYNCFHDAVHGIERKYKVVRWAQYNAAKRHNPKVSIVSYTEEVTLKYERLPGYEHLTQREYAKLMHEELERRRAKIVRERYAQGKGFMGREALLNVRPGSVPKKTKQSNLYSHRPRVISLCPQRYRRCLDWYFRVYFAYKEAARRFRAGENDVIFPEGTYPPWRTAFVAAV